MCFGNAESFVIIVGLFTTRLDLVAGGVGLDVIIVGLLNTRTGLLAGGFGSVVIIVGSFTIIVCLFVNGVGVLAAAVRLVGLLYRGGGRSAGTFWSSVNVTVNSCPGKHPSGMATNMNRSVPGILHWK